MAFKILCGWIGSVVVLVGELRCKRVLYFSKSKAEQKKSKKRAGLLKPPFNFDWTTGEPLERPRLNQGGAQLVGMDIVLLEILSSLNDSMIHSLEKQANSSLSSWAKPHNQRHSELQPVGAARPKHLNETFSPFHLWNGWVGEEPLRKSTAVNPLHSW